MPLEEYARKRNFSKTPEPAPDPAQALPAVAAPRFYVQRHDARRLHYDFRLEIGGTLVSWAVPKGPSLDPAVKAFAAHVEDHPLDYGEFEGNIPAGNYGAGSVMLWDRGTFEVLGDMAPQDQMARGDLKFRLHGEKLNGDFAIVKMKGRGKGEEWLLIKKKDAFATPGYDIEQYARSVKTGRTQEEIAKNLEPAQKAEPKKRSSRKKSSFQPPQGAVAAPMPQSITPMLAQLADHPPSGKGWVYEIKWDGVRALCFVDQGQLRVFSRAQNPCERQYPELHVLPHYVNAAQAILDGEIAVLDDKGRSRFELIQPRIHPTDPNAIAHLARKTPATLFLFDVLYVDGYDLRSVPLAERRKILESLVKPADRIHVSEQFHADGAAMLEAARQHGLEGVVAKQESSLYEPKRSSCWLKLKVTGEQEFLICGFTHGERSYFSSLVLGAWKEGELQWVGNVGTGFDDRTLRDVYAKLEPLIVDKMPFSGKPGIPRKTTWVKPELVCAVRYVEWTREGRLRAPVFLGLRADKKPQEVVIEVPVDPDEPAGTETEKASGLLLEGKEKEAVRTIDGQTLKFSNLDKIFYPREGYTKRDLLNYYNDIAELILPHLAGRPLSLKRYPNGIHQDFFFQKHVAEGYPDWLRLEPIESEHRGEAIHYVICNDRATLLYLTNLGCIDQNPWMSRLGSLECPDFVLIDLDPQEAGYDLIVEAALLVHEQLKAIGIEGYPKTTGGDGMHIYIPLEPVYTYDQVRQFAEILSILTIHQKPDLFTTPRSVAKRRKGRVYFDWMQIASSKTISAPYVLRAHDGAPVATPLEWSEVRRGLTPGDFTLANVRERFARVGDLFRPVLEKRQRLEPALKRLSARMSQLQAK